MSTVAAELASNVLENNQRHVDGDEISSIRFKHYSGGIKTPFSDFKLRMEQIHVVNLRRSR